MALSHVGVYQASAARALIHLGALVAIIAGQKNEKLKISMRATQDLYRETGLHLGREVAKPLGDYIEAWVGGTLSRRESTESENWSLASNAALGC